MRPVPVVFLRLAFSLQLSDMMISNNLEIDEGVPTLPYACSWVTAVGAGVFLDVKRSPT
jgi:hypothetical protein